MHTNQLMPIANMSTLQEVEQLIENHLAHDWVLRVEHSSEINRHHTRWSQWSNALYKISEVTGVIDHILACHASHPTHSIRLYAEKIQPRTQLIYWVYRAPDDSRQTLPAAAAPAITNAGNWLASMQNSFNQLRARTWRVVTLIGTVLVSLLFIETVMT